MFATVRKASKVNLSLLDKLGFKFEDGSSSQYNKLACWLHPILWKMSFLIKK